MLHWQFDEPVCKLKPQSPINHFVFTTPYSTLYDVRDEADPGECDVDVGGLSAFSDARF